MRMSKEPRVNVRIGEEVMAKLRRYIVLRWGGTESIYGKTTLVVTMALERFLDEELPKLEEKAGN